jgi:hypothetical protein
MFCRTHYHTCLHLALLCICDTCALDATDWDALTAQYDLLFMVIIVFCLYDLLFMVIIVFCLYDTHCVDI